MEFRHLHTFEKHTSHPNYKLRDMDLLDTEFKGLKDIFENSGYSIKKCLCKDLRLKVTVVKDGRDDRIDYDMENLVEKYVSEIDNIIGWRRSEWRLSKKTENWTSASYFFVLKYGLCDRFSKVYHKYFEFMDKYNIRKWVDFLDVVGLSARDCNKFAKAKGEVSKKQKSLCYKVKDWVIGFFAREDYIDKLFRHDIDGMPYLLVYTKTKNSELMDGCVSFHIPSFRYGKFREYFREIESYPTEDREYVKGNTPILNKERMFDFLDIVNPGMFSTEHINIIKGYIESRK